MYKISDTFSKKTNAKTRGPDREGGGPDRGGGSRSGGGVQVKELLSNSFFVLAVCGGKIFSNFLFFSLFSRIFSNFLEGQIGGGCRRHFLYLIFFWGKFFSQIFSFFLFFSRIFSEYICMYWHSGKIFSNFLFFSRIFSKGGVPDRRHFLYLTFWGKNYLKFFRFSRNAFFVSEVCWGNITPNFFKVAHGRFFSLVFFNISNLNFP